MFCKVQWLVSETYLMWGLPAYERRCCWWRCAFHFLLTVSHKFQVSCLVQDFTTEALNCYFQSSEVTGTGTPWDFPSFYQWKLLSSISFCVNKRKVRGQKWEKEKKINRRCEEKHQDSLKTYIMYCWQLWRDCRSLFNEGCVY